jgi:NAD(P)-dependent dehydrogenase (short-subunit alcohol dehydrogenase family)
MATILVIGASRGIGLETVKALLRAGHSVRALARSASKIPIKDANLDKVCGDALDSDTIREPSGFRPSTGFVSLRRIISIKSGAGPRSLVRGGRYRQPRRGA